MPPLFYDISNLDWQIEVWECSDIMHVICLAVDGGVGDVNCVNVTVFCNRDRTAGGRVEMLEIHDVHLDNRVVAVGVLTLRNAVGE